MPDNDRSIAPDSRKSSPPGRAGNRLTRYNRLPDEKSFARVFAKANRSRDNLFTVLSRANGTDYGRLGLAISRKHCPKASGRNRLKRLVRESFRHHAHELRGIDVVVMGQPGTSQAGNRMIFDSLARHWQATRSRNSAPGDE